MINKVKLWFLCEFSSQAVAFQTAFHGFFLLDFVMQFFKVIPSKKNRFVAQTVNLDRNLKSFERHGTSMNKLHICKTTRWQVAVALSCHSQAANPPSHLVQRMRQEVKCDSSGWPTALPPLRPFYLSRSFFLNIGKTVMIPSNCCTKTSPVSYAKKKSPEGKWSSNI